jgi:glycosyltransferase involved in cell wall biosynthesis
MVFHPGLQHSHQLAWALEERALLQEFISGIPVLGPDEKMAQWWLPSRLKQRVKEVGIPSSRKSHPVFLYALQRLIATLPSGSLKNDFLHKSFHLFDLWASRHVLARRPAAVVAFENSAYHTFKAAKQVGAKCILDLPSIERHAADEFVRTQKTRYSSVINERKDAELEMADLVLTCSKFAAETYIDAGISREKTRWLNLGATIPKQQVSPPAVNQESLRFVFVGSFGFRKSADLILDAFAKLQVEGYPISLDIVGRIESHIWKDRIRKSSNVRFLGHLPQSQVYDVLRESDCLLLPSRFDSFGMVVAEAMACGTPVIVSRTVGAKELVESHPGSGWIIDATEQSICQCIRDRWLRRSELSTARLAATRAGFVFTWEAYRREAGMLVEDWLNRNTSPVSSRLE